MLLIDLPSIDELDGYQPFRYLVLPFVHVAERTRPEKFFALIPTHHIRKVSWLNYLQSARVHKRKKYYINSPSAIISNMLKSLVGKLEAGTRVVLTNEKFNGIKATVKFVGPLDNTAA